MFVLLPQMQHSLLRLLELNLLWVGSTLDSSFQVLLNHDWNLFFDLSQVVIHAFKLFEELSEMIAKRWIVPDVFLHRKDTEVSNREPLACNKRSKMVFELLLEESQGWFVNSLNLPADFGLDHLLIVHEE